MITRSGLPSYAYPGMITKSGLPSHDYPGSTKRIEIPNELVKPLSLFLFSASPLHLPSGDISTESRVYLVGLREKFEVAKQFIDQILKVYAIIGKSGETIKHIRLESGAKIQLTKDTDAGPNSPTTVVELNGTSQQISSAQKLINDVLAEVALSIGLVNDA
ncbi:hypothetical protein B296_00034618 [Ensete ventricosum]|uniref:K Homology domain-containing protein n=1 Tax=Ensete ventricosum TaxID=4639 RepID=A0A426ZI25_ENSVE|nr:hypothetical protein B296_00034618 [Ensete ventricosum]